MVERVQLRDGTEALIWPLLPTDDRTLAEDYEHLSPRSRIRRFLGGAPHLTRAMLHHLVDEVDGRNHIALVLVAFPADGPDTPAGVARVVRYPDKPSTADVAVTVLDDWQGRGVGSALVEALKEHIPDGVTDIETEIFEDNRASLALLRHLGDVDVEHRGDGRLHVLVHLRDPAHPGSSDGPVDAGGRPPRPVARRRR